MNHIRARRVGSVLAGLAAACGWLCGASAETLERIVPREDPKFDCASAVIAVGQDGLVYLQSGGHVLAVTPDGGRRREGDVVLDGCHNATANAAGVLATANAHFQHAVYFYDGEFEKTAACAEYKPKNYDGPTRVEAGLSGDFYGLDRDETRVLRMSPAGGIVKVLGYPATMARVTDMRVAERAGAVYLLADDNRVHCVGFDGVVKWQREVSFGWHRAWTVDDSGGLVVCRGEVLLRWGADGEPLPELTLAAGDGSKAPVTGIAFAGPQIVVKRADPRELFAVHDARTGGFIRSVPAAHERATAELPGLVWTAGESVRLAIRTEAAAVAGRPQAEMLQWRVWASPFGDADWRELPWKDGGISVPKGFAGLYQIRIAPTANATAASEYTLRGVVEVRAASSAGTVSAWTPLNRIHWARGEAIPVSVELRSKEAGGPGSATLALEEEGGAKPAWTTEIPLERGRPAEATVPPEITATLAPGRYALRVGLAGFTSVPQPILIGGPLGGASPFRITLYGDYGNFNSTADAWSFADVAEAMLSRSRLLGINQYVNRIHVGRYPLAFAGTDDAAGLLDRVQKRLAADPDATAPQKASFGFPQAHVLGGFGAHGIREWLMLVYMDALLPMGTDAGYCGPIRPEAAAQEIGEFTRALRQFPAFTGWDWVANWWAARDKAFGSPEEKAAYEAALGRARETGAWSPILDTIGDRIVAWQPEAQQVFQDAFKDALDTVDPHRRTASSGPYRRPEVYPPDCFANVDEVDLHYQCEQITTPNWTPHAVDFYKRPGKPAWMHPELFNDIGTGEQILPMSFLGLMRGADGIGKEGEIPAWGGSIPSDPRSAYAGSLSVHRALHDVAKAYGPWLTTLGNADLVAIPVSRRHVKLDDFNGGVGGRYFARLFTAYQDCLHARRPATFVFAEDGPDMGRFKAVLLVGLQYEPEPAFTALVDAARAAGARIHADASCRESLPLVKNSTPLGFAFSEKLGGHNDDTMWWKCERGFLADAPQLAAALADAVPPVAEINAHGVLAGERRGPGGGRFVWLVNNTRTPLDQGVHYRVSSGIAACMPVVAKVGLPVAAGEIVYDVFARREVAGSRRPAANGRGESLAFEADLRFLPARLYCILPARIAGLRLDAPRRIEPGAAVEWKAAVTGAAGPLAAGLPLAVRLLDGDGRVIEERFTATGSGSLTAPANARPPLAVAATELVTGRSSQPSPAEAEPPLGRFGPRLRDVAVSADGGTALINAFDWGHNLYAIDTATGKVRWTGTVGDHFAFGPVPLGDGFAVQGFDLATGEGYHLHAFDPSGRVQRRFALPGLPARMVSWCFPMNLNDHIANFAVAPDGGWIAAAGNLASACWKPDGTLLWSRDWSRETRRSPRLLAADARTLLSTWGNRLSAVDPLTGKDRWKFATEGEAEIKGLAASGDGTTVAASTLDRGGTVWLVRDGRPAGLVRTKSDAAVLARDGRWLAVTAGPQLQVYDTAAATSAWNFAADATLRFPAVSPDGSRLAVSSEMGTLYIFEMPSGRLVLERDLGGIPATAWMPDGDLLAATWMGTVRRFDAGMKERWRVNLSGERLPGGKTAKPSVPTARLTSWVNAEPKPWPLAPNLLDAASTNVSVTVGDGWTKEIAADGLFDGRDEPPQEPRLDWFNTSMINSGWRGDFSLVFDTFREQLRVDAITLVEDPAHPESWFRDARLEYWDVARGRWVFAHYLTSDGPVHTHRLAAPIEARKFRLTKPDAAGWGTGGLRLAEVVFHGEGLGCSHPDARSNRPVAVLFDEEKIFAPAPGWVQPQQFEWRTGPDAASGAVAIVLPGQGGSALAGNTRFGQSIADWDFEIVEKPGKPGEYRWLQFSCKAVSPEARGGTVVVGWSPLGPQTPNILSSFICLDVGDPLAVVWPWPRHQLPDRLQPEWTDVRVDLWKAIQSLPEKDRQPFRVQGFSLMASGGGVAFDRILLGRTVEDLRASKPIRP